MDLLPGTRLELIASSPAREGEDLLLRFQGPPSAAVYLFASFALAPVQGDPWRGTLLLGSPRSLAYHGVTEASGDLRSLVPLGLLPGALEARRLFLQPFLIEPSLPAGRGKVRALADRFTLGAGAGVVVLDQAF